MLQVSEKWAKVVQFCLCKYLARGTLNHRFKLKWDVQSLVKEHSHMGVMSFQG